MSSTSSLLAYLGLLIVLFGIVCIVMGIGLMRARQKERRVAGSSGDVEKSRGPIAEHLRQYPAKSDGDARGEDIGGNFSRVPRPEDSQRNFTDSRH